VEKKDYLNNSSFKEGTGKERGHKIRARKSRVFKGERRQKEGKQLPSGSSQPETLWVYIPLAVDRPHRDTEGRWYRIILQEKWRSTDAARAELTHHEALQRPAPMDEGRGGACFETLGVGVNLLYQKKR